jgi:hypothetical protein
VFGVAPDRRGSEPQHRRALGDDGVLPVHVPLPIRRVSVERAVDLHAEVLLGPVEVEVAAAAVVVGAHRLALGLGQPGRPAQPHHVDFRQRMRPPLDVDQDVEQHHPMPDRAGGEQRLP